MKKEKLFEAIGNADEKYLKESEKYRGVKRAYFRAIAACLAVALLAVPVLNAFFNRETQIPENALVLNAAVSPENLTGTPSANLTFKEGAQSSVNYSPPAYYFPVSAFVVRAELLEIRSDLYNSNKKVMKFRTLEVINGKNVPNEFYYLINGHIESDFFAYDTFIISMVQCGTENYVIKNVTKNGYEALDLPVFTASRYITDTGCFIAFNDGIFDERLWQEDELSWNYVYAKYRLDDGDESMMVYRGCTEEYTINKIKDILANPQKWEDIYHYDKVQGISAVTLDFETEEAKAALEYVKPFENGVFIQSKGNSYITYTRYINGCETNEWVKIDIETEEVTYSEERYTREDLENVENIALHIANMKESFAVAPPSPLHTNEEGKTLLSVNLYGRYIKKDGVVYGVIEIYWTYEKEGNERIQYYDDQFIVYGNKNHIATTMPREKYIEQLGKPYYKTHEYEKEYEILIIQY